MSFQPVMLYSMDADFIGYTILGQNGKLQSTNTYAAGEEDKLNARIAELNTEVDLNAYWPNPKDPEVLKLLDDPSFVPIEYVETDVIDDENSWYVWQQVAEVDAYGNPTGEIVDSEHIDETASVIRYKRGRVPKRPTDHMWRIKSASEVVARRRAGLDD
jgi:hypothetical protein